MPRSRDDGFEVLLGNKQLLSVFFILVILLAAFFTMGYVLGRNSALGGVSLNMSRKAAPVASGSTASGFSDTSGSPASSPSAAEPATPAAATATEGTQSQPPAVEDMPTGPVSGQTYLQAVAGKRPDAELIAGVLRKKGLPTLIAPSPTESIFRVLVGPLADANAITKARADLEAAGFQPILRKY